MTSLHLGIFKCTLGFFLLLFVLLQIVLYHFVFLPDVDALLRFVPPKHKSKFFPVVPKSQCKRQLRVKEVCANHSLQSKTISDRFLIDESRKIACCLISKVGATNWKRALILSTGRISESDFDKLMESRNGNTTMNPSSFLHMTSILFWKFGLYHSDQYIQSTLKQLMPDFFKFMFVRCPYQRLLSAYRDKFENADYISKKIFQKTFGVEILKRYRMNITLSSAETGSDVTFHEFLQFIADTVDEGKPLEKHWRPFYQLCDPCLHNFDFIGKLETLEEDSQYVLHRLGRDVRFPASASGPSSSRYAKNNTASQLEYYSQIPPLLLQRITKIYYIDFTLFGYKTDLKKCFADE